MAGIGGGTAAFVAFVVLLDVLPRAAGGLGDSAEGAAASSWAVVGRALARVGPDVDTGGVVQSLWISSQHPPGTTLVSWAMHVLGVDPAFTQAPAVVAGIASIFLLYSLLRWVSASVTGAVVSLCLVVGTPLFLQNAALLRPSVLAFPFILLLLREDRQAEQGSARGHAGVSARAALFAGLAGLTAWCGLLVAMALSGIALARARRDGRRPSSHALGLLLGTTIALGIVGLWVSLPRGVGQAPLGDLVSLGAGSPVLLRLTDLVMAFSHQVPPWIVVLVVPALVAAVANRSTRRVTLVSMGAALIVPSVLRDDAIATDGWPLLVVVPLAVGVSRLVDSIVGMPRWSADRRLRFALVVIGLVTVVVSTVIPGDVDSAYGRGLDAVAVARDLTLPAGQRQAFAYPADVRPSWLWFHTGLPAHAVDAARLRELADTDVDVKVVVAREAPLLDGKVWLAISFLSDQVTGSYAAISASDLTPFVSPPPPPVPVDVEGIVSVSVLANQPTGWRIAISNEDVGPVRLDEVSLLLGVEQVALVGTWLPAGARHVVCIGPAHEGCDTAVEVPAGLDMADMRLVDGPGLSWSLAPR